MINPASDKNQHAGVLNLENIANKQNKDNKLEEIKKEEPINTVLPLGDSLKQNSEEIGIGKNLDITACYIMINLCYAINEIYKINL